MVYTYKNVCIISKVLSVCKTKQKLFMNTRCINKSYNKKGVNGMRTTHISPVNLHKNSILCISVGNKHFVIYGDCVFWVSLGIHLNKRNPIYEPIYKMAYI